MSEWVSAIALKNPPQPFHLLESPAAYLQISDNIQPCLDALGLTLEHQVVAAYAQRDPYPLPDTSDREGYCGDRHLEYWLMGLQDLLTIQSILTSQNTSLAACQAVLDLGCASGRMLRFYDCQMQIPDLWGTDINSRNIEWVRQHLSPRLKVYQNTVLPHLPLEDNSLDFVSAFSVFTHIDDLEMMWLAELRRVLKPGGYAYITLHTDHTWDYMDETYVIYNTLLATRDLLLEHQERIQPGFNQDPMFAPRIVFTNRSGQVYNTNVFHHRDYIYSTWGRFLKVVEIYPTHHGYQDVVLLQKH